MDSLPNTGQAGTVSHEVIVTPAMVEAGVAQYRYLASHDEMSWVDAKQLVESILSAALLSQKGT